MRSSFDPYASGYPVPTPGRLTVRKDAAAGRHVFILPDKPAVVVSRVVFMEVEGVGTRTVSASTSAQEVSYAFPPGVMVVAFLTYQDGRGERSRAGPLLRFWTPQPEDQG